MEKSDTNFVLKQEELLKFRSLVLATIDYYLENEEIQIKNSGFDSFEYYKNLKVQTEEYFQKGKLSILKKWFRDLSEMQIQCMDLKFNEYLKEKTKLNVNIFESYFKRIENIIVKEKITSDNEFYEVNNFIENLSQIKPIDNIKIEQLNILMRDYEQRKSKRKAH